MEWGYAAFGGFLWAITPFIIIFVILKLCFWVYEKIHSPSELPEEENTDDTFESIYDPEDEKPEKDDYYYKYDPNQYGGGIKQAIHTGDWAKAFTFKSKDIK